MFLGIQWSDGFDPNSSSKSNRGSVWTKTVTFLSNNSTRNKLEDACSITTRLKGNSHDVPEHMFIKDLLDLLSGVNNVFYSVYYKYI